MDNQQFDFYKKYTMYKTDYTNLSQCNQSGGKKAQKNIFQTNIFLNKDHFGMHHNIDHRKRRLHDFNQIIDKLKNHLVPKNKIEIDQPLLKKYINLHKKENQNLVRTIIDNLQYITFKEFYQQLHAQIIRFNSYCKENLITKYVFVLGVGSNEGYSATNYDLFKSNLWVFLLAYKFLKVKPYDIVLNLNIGIRLHRPYLAKDRNSWINDFLFVDDCSYSGAQLVYGVLKSAAPELLYESDDAFVINDKVMYEPVLDKKCNVHLLIPYVSSIALTKINDFEITSGFNIIMYVSKIVKTYGKILDEPTLKKISELYKNIYFQFADFANLTPIYFQHKIADYVSTIDLILIKGQVLDDQKKKLVFIKECEYDKNDPKKAGYNPEHESFIYKKIYCPIPPYLEFEKYLSA